MTDVIPPTPASSDEPVVLSEDPTAWSPARTAGSSSEQGELARLRHLVGPEELDYVALRRENWRLRDELIGELQRNGRLQSQVLTLTDQLETERRRADGALLRFQGRSFALGMRIAQVLRLPVRAARRLGRVFHRG